LSRIHLRKTTKNSVPVNAVSENVTAKDANDSGDAIPIMMMDVASRSKRGLAEKVIGLIGVGNWRMQGIGGVRRRE